MLKKKKEENYLIYNFTLVTIQCGGVKFPHTNPQIFTKSSTAVHGCVFTSILRRKIKNILSLEKYGS